MIIKIKGDIISNDFSMVYDFFGEDYVSPQKVEDALKEANGEDIELEIASYGGYVTAAIEIYDALSNYPGKVTAKISFACSAATIISCAAEESLISEIGFFMIHNVRNYTEGDKQQMEYEGKVLDALDQGLINAYEKKTGLSREEIQKMMNEETYLSANEAVEKGFVDGLATKADNVANITDVLKNAVASKRAFLNQDKAMELLQYVRSLNKQIPDNNVGSDTTTQKGEHTMGLKEIMAEHPEISNEIEEKIAEAKAQGAAEERARMQSLDNIAKTVTPEMLNEAKYGEQLMDGPSLAYKAMQENQLKADAYLKAVSDDAKDSNTAEVGTFQPDMGEPKNSEETEAEDMADYINQKKGVK